MKKTVVILPTYNEANNLPLMVAELLALNIPELTILVVDDNSPDGTGEIADELAKEHPDLLFVLHQDHKLGLGRAYIAGFRWAFNYNVDHIIQMDCDFSHAPSHIPEMLAEIADYDLIVGSRYISGGQLDERWSVWRYLLSWWANAIYTRLLLNLKTRDSTAGFKCWKKESLQQIDLSRISSHGYSFQFEMAYISEKLGYKIKEIPIYFEDRRIGQSKLTVPIKIEAALRTWQILWQYRNLKPIPPKNATTKS